MSDRSSDDNEIDNSHDGEDDWPELPPSKKSRQGGTQLEEMCDSTGQQDTSSSDQMSNPTTTIRAKSKFNAKWLSEFPVLTYDNVKNVMFCTVCQKHKKSNQYAQGTSNFKRTNILRHIHSHDHKNALQAEGVSLSNSYHSRSNWSEN